MTIATQVTKRRGRPTVFTRVTRNRLAELISAGVPIVHACAACRVSLSGFHSYRASHPAFAARIERSTAEAIEKHLRLIIRAAESGDAACSRWFLERVHPAHFARTKIELTGADGQPLAAAIALYLPQKDSPGTNVMPAKVIGQ